MGYVFSCIFAVICHASGCLGVQADCCLREWPLHTYGWIVLREPELLCCAVHWYMQCCTDAQLSVWDKIQLEPLSGALKDLTQQTQAIVLSSILEGIANLYQ